MSDGRVFSEGNAELLVYLVEEEKIVYIGGCHLPPRTCSAGLSPAESLSYLAVAESLRTGKWRPRRGLYGIEKDRGKRSRDFAVHREMYGELRKGFRAVSWPTVGIHIS